MSTKENYLLPEKFSIVFKHKPLELKPRMLFLGKQTHYATPSTANGFMIHDSIENAYLVNGIADAAYFHINEAFTIGKYSTIVITYDGTTAKLYSNAKKLGEISGYHDLNSKLFIGGGIYSGGYEAGIYWNYAKGYFKEIRIYNDALMPEQLIEFNE